MNKENIRRKIHPDIESVPIGFANGQAQSNPLTEEEKQLMIEEATIHYGRFLDALKCDWRNDVTSFPSDGYRGIVLEKDIPVVSQCSHHHQTILGKAHIAYIPGKDGRVIGLSKLNRIVEHFSRRGAIQESLTMAIHGALNKVLKNTDGVMVMLQATHNCVSCRGVKHMGASMITSEVSGAFADHQKTAKQEVMHMIGYGLDAYK